MSIWGKAKLQPSRPGIGNQPVPGNGAPNGPYVRGYDMRNAASQEERSRFRIGLTAGKRRQPGMSDYTPRPVLSPGMGNWAYNALGLPAFSLIGGGTRNIEEFRLPPTANVKHFGVRQFGLGQSVGFPQPQGQNLLTPQQLNSQYGIGPGGSVNPTYPGAQ